MSGDDIKGEPTITLRQKEKADEILGMKMRSKLHRQKELRNGVVSDISTSDFEPIDKYGQKYAQQNNELLHDAYMINHAYIL